MLNVDSISKNMKTFTSLGLTEVSLNTKIKLYKKRAAEIEDYLSKRPEDWKKFQNEFNSELNNIFRDILNFEKDNFVKGSYEKVRKLKKIFIKRFRKVFMKGVYGPWSIVKPFGYAGDFKIIDDIHQNNPTTTGFDRLFDNYFQASAISEAVRNRKDDFERIIIDFTNKKHQQSVKIMNLGCGACRDVKEIATLNNLINKNIFFDCYDREKRALEFAKTLLTGFSNVNFFQKNALKLAATKDISSLINKRYDLIYATGIFDYFDHKICVRLVSNLKKLLNVNGVMAISNVRDKYSNPSVHYMEWAGGWNLIYRTEEEFKNIFLEAGFREKELKILHERQGVMQYIIASKSKV